MSFVAPVLVPRAMVVSNKYLPDADFCHPPFSRDISHLPMLSTPARSRPYQVTTVEKMSICGLNCYEQIGLTVASC
jgi:hypothetical protein